MAGEQDKINIHLECSNCFHEESEEFGDAWGHWELCPSCNAEGTYNVVRITRPRAIVDILMDMRRHIK